MLTNRPRRLQGVAYHGPHRYSITTCTAFRRPIFREEEVVVESLAQLRQTATLFDFDVLAYCFMHDHLHLLLVGRSEAADLLAFMKRFKQLTGFVYRRKRRASLWQPGYYEHVLRDDEATMAVVRYILENPVRGGLASALFEYPFAGSEVYDQAALLSAWDEEAGRRKRT